VDMDEKNRPLVRDARKFGSRRHSLRGVEFQTDGQFSHRVRHRARRCAVQYF
jgi:hypothetical protein